MQSTASNLENKDRIDKNIKRKVLILSFFCFLVSVTFSSFSVVVIYIHQKYKHKGYGQTYLTANSLVSVLTYIFCPFIFAKAKDKSKLLLLICAIGYMLNMLIPAILAAAQTQYDASIPPSTLRFVLQIIANCIGGAASGVFWILQSIYMANYCDAVPENQKGKYFAISNAILNTRIIAGPLITMIGLGLGNQTIYFALLSFIVIISIPIPIFFIPPINLQHLQTLKLSNVSENQQNISQKDEKNKLFPYLLSYLKYFKNIKFLAPTSILAGLIVSFVSSSLSHFLPKPGLTQTNDSKVSIALIFFGIGNIVGGYLSGWLCDKILIKKAGYFGHSLVVIGSIIEAISLFTTKEFWKSCLIGFTSGLSYSYLFSYVAIVCTIYYNGNSFSFSTNKQITSFSYIGYQWLVAFLNNQCNMKLNMTYQGLALIPIAFFASYCLHIQTKNHQNDKKQGQGISSQGKQFQCQTKNLDKQTSNQLE